MATFEYGSAGTNLTGHIINVYSPEAIRETIRIDAPTLALFKASGKQITAGAGAYFEVRTKDVTSRGHRLDSGDLPTAGVDESIQLVVKAKPFYSVLQFSNFAVELASGRPGSFVDMLTDQFNRQLLEDGHFLNNDCFGDNTGVLATVTATNGTTITFDDVSRLREGQSLDFLDVTGASAATTTISNISWENNTAVVASATGVAVGDGAYPAGTQDGSSLGDLAYDGLTNSIATTGSYLGKARSSYPAIKSNVIAVNGPIDEDQMYRLKNRIGQKVGGMVSASEYVLVTNPNQVRKWSEIQYPRQQFGTGSLRLGTDGKMNWDGFEVVADFSCPSTTVFMLKRSELKQFKTPNGDLQISQRGANAGFRFVSGKDAVQSVTRAYDNCVVTNPAACGALTALTDVANR